jgi:hypothetical protein
VTSDGKTVKIRCTTWDQVEAFYTDKLRGNVLVVKMPFRPGMGESVTVALGLPDGLVFAIDGTVMKIGAEDQGKIPVALRLIGMTLEVRAQLKRLVAQGRGALPPAPRSVGTKPPRGRAPETLPPAPAPRLDDVAADEKAAFVTLLAVHRRLLSLPAHEVLDVARDADAETVRAGYLAKCQKLHPDVYRRYRSPALHALASEVFGQVRRAFERLCGVLPAEGWLVAVDESAAPAEPAQEGGGVPTEPLAATSSSPYSELQITTEAQTSPSYDDELSFTSSVRMKALTAEELFDDETTPPPPAAPSEAGPPPLEVETAPAEPAAPPPQPAPSEPPATAPLVASGREALSDGRWRDACEAFAAVLRAEPRNRHVRALYHVANGMDLRTKGEGAQARLQFETALAHDRDCEEAQRALAGHEPAPDKDRDKKGIFMRLFER